MLRSSFLWLCVFAGAVLMLTGCPPTYPKCSSDEGCKDHGEVCVQGQCQECATDQNCKQGFVCQDGKCAPKPECTNDSACGSGKKCQAGKCVIPSAAKPGCTRNNDCPSGQECQEGTCMMAGSGSECGFNEPVRFGFNDASLTSDAQQHLSSLADCVKKRGVRVRLEGHADERGTEEYNLQLSNRRAASVKKYLADLGVSSNKLETVGYGENRPANPGHDEAAWAENRRVEFKPATQ